MGKLEFSVTTSNVEEKLAYWPIAAILFMLFLHFFTAKSMTLTIIYPRNKSQSFFL